MNFARSISFFLVSSLLGNLSFGAQGSCQRIEKACLKAGYLVDGGRKENTDLWNDCVKPVLAGRKATVEGFKLSSKVIEKCKSENPNFGQKGAL